MTVIVDADRVRGASSAKTQGATVVVLDDAFQHRRAARDADVVLVAAEQGGASAPAASKPAPVSAPAPVVRRAEGDGGRRIAVPSAPAAPPPPKEVLVIASRLKDYIRTRYGMNTSDGVLEELSDHLRKLADRAVMHAREDGRKTVLDRDFAFLSEKS